MEKETSLMTSMCKLILKKKEQIKRRKYAVCLWEGTVLVSVKILIQDFIQTEKKLFSLQDFIKNNTMDFKTCLNNWIHFCVADVV